MCTMQPVGSPLCSYVRGCGADVRGGGGGDACVGQSVRHGDDCHCDVDGGGDGGGGGDHDMLMVAVMLCERWCRWS